jgi:diadenylate cyclase
MHWRTFVDFASAATFLYVLLRLARDAKALRTAMVAVGLYIASLAARNLDLMITAWVLETSALIGAGVLILAFHTELRYAIVRFNSLFRIWPAKGSAMEPWKQVLADAVFSMAESRTGALNVVRGRVPIADNTTGGIPLSADVSMELLQAIFQKGSPLHDGAVVIENGRIARANMVLPLSEKDDLPNHYGTRHRAGLGLAERTDALIIVVSEQRGEVSVMRSGRILTVTSEDQILRRLGTTASGNSRSLGRFAHLAIGDLRIKFVAAVLAAFVCLISSVTARTSVRVVSVPVEFTGVRRGTELFDPSSSRLILQLRLYNRSTEPNGLSRLVAHFNVENVQPGIHQFRVTPENIDLPAGVSLEAVTPPDVSVRVVRPAPDAAAGAAQ